MPVVICPLAGYSSRLLLVSSCGFTNIFRLPRRSPLDIHSGDLDSAYAPLSELLGQLSSWEAPDFDLHWAILLTPIQNSFMKFSNVAYWFSLSKIKTEFMNFTKTDWRFSKFELQFWLQKFLPCIHSTHRQQTLKKLWASNPIRRVVYTQPFTYIQY